MSTQLAFAATAGMLAAFNPCGFALLPGYLTMFLAHPPSRRSVVGRAVLVGAAVTTGFVAVFGAVGGAIAALSLTLGPWLAVVTLVAGVALLVVGATQVLGRDIWVPFPRSRLPVNGTVAGMAAYGIVYAMVSLSCTLPVFGAAVVSAFAGPGPTFAGGALSAAAYAVGMGLVMVTLALVVGLLGQDAIARTRGWVRHVGRASGVMVLAAAAYVLWYGWVELATDRGATVSPGPVTLVSAASGRVSQLVTDRGAGATLLALACGLAAAAGATFVTRRRRG
ncbi:cytochrome c biogenesis CcdA family protein [Nostocoides sp. HKS02]|uniref:cytochrome c biogenesis CcdA family protein n=1 Tax=Nostocoides sp. HKS02 TaxID=1813880 RepID=UPI0012B4DE52|nr:cytochrome c biogenesis protein CcdA [Tetrasphaera sp. HKS02]QGN58076.1 cytochrome c biogenesis protein CcdA [Tetrasphaera sp. HKS02]